VTRAKTTAQWRREVPAFDRAHKAVVALIANWPGCPRMTDHLNEDTLVVSIILHGNRADCSTADRLLDRLHYADLAGRRWVAESFQGHAFFRKVTR
jgi:hypothetical protein